MVRCWLKFLLYCFVRLCGALNRSCVVHPDADQTIYNISDVSQVLGVRASRCMYTWSNGSNHVLANNKEEIPELVTKNSINTLVTSVCFDKLVLTRHCVPQPEFTAICTTNCSENAQLQTDKDIFHSCVVAIAVSFLLLGLAGFLYYSFRDRIPSCSQLRCDYTSVQKKDDDPKAVNVETVKK